MREGFGGDTNKNEELVSREVTRGSAGGIWMQTRKAMGIVFVGRAC